MAVWQVFKLGRSAAVLGRSNAAELAVSDNFERRLLRPGDGRAPASFWQHALQ